MDGTSKPSPFQSSKELYLRGVINIRIARRLHFPILKGTLSSRSDTSCGIMVSAFQSSKELYLPNHQKQQLHDRALSNPQRNFIFKKRSGTRKSKRELYLHLRTRPGGFFLLAFPILKGTLSSSNCAYPRVAVVVFPILKGTLSSLPAMSPCAYGATFQSSKELYLPPKT